MPVTFLTHPDYARHLTGPGHPERPERLPAVLRAIERSGLEDHLRRLEPDPIERHLLTSVHSERYVEQVRAVAAGGGGHLDADTVVSPDSYEAALLAAGGAVAAMREAVTLDGRAFALVRPPGHQDRKSVV